MYTYAAISLSNVIATWCQYEALKYVSFPTQTLGKCGKMIPVMIMGAILSGKRFVFPIARNSRHFLTVWSATTGRTTFPRLRSPVAAWFSSLQGCGALTSPSTRH